MTPDGIIAERNATHGNWEQQSATAQALKDVLRESHNWSALTASQREALEMICVKVSRIVNGDPNCKDHWDDVGGYGRLGERGRETAAVLNG